VTLTEANNGLKKNCEVIVFADKTVLMFPNKFDFGVSTLLATYTLSEKILVLSNQRQSPAFGLDTVALNVNIGNLVAHTQLDEQSGC